MQVLIRTDASLQIGTGHVIRCLTLADSLRSQGIHCEFICRFHDGNLIDLIKGRGFSVVALPVEFPVLIQQSSAKSSHSSSKYGDWLGVTQQEDAAECINVLSNRRFDWVIVDHYGIGQEWESSIRCIAKQIFVIDDLADRQHDCDMLLDQNLGRSKIDYILLVPQSCRLLIGPSFALLRPEFHVKRNGIPLRKARVGIQRVLVSMGGIDRDNITKQVLEALSHSAEILPQDCLVQVVMGAKAPWMLEIKDFTLQVPFACEVLVNVENMAELMTQADLAVGAVGVTAWERCCLGLPTLAIVLAENQRLGAESLARVGAVALLPHGPNMVAVMKSQLNMLLKQEFIIDMQNACYKVTDGLGTEKVTNFLIA